MKLLPRRSLLATALLCLIFIMSAQAAEIDGPALLASPLRTEADRQADAGRRPLDLIRFAGVQPGMTVLDIVSGGGYTAQIMALAVGPQGKVYAQASRSRETLDKRLAANPQANFEPLVRPLEDLYPADLPRVDIATLILNYHDIAYSPIDRSKMNRAIFSALKPGGKLVLIDHAAKAGSGTNDSKTLHRIDEQTVRSELTAAGFVLEAEGEFLRNPQDPREQVFSDMKMPADRFALRFVKPK